MTQRIGLSRLLLDRDDLVKGRRGGGHKYIRRVRTTSGGKLVWKYYYADDISRQRGEAQQKAKKGKKKALHGLISELETDHPEMFKPRDPLGDLTPENVTDGLNWKHKPRVSFGTDQEEADYHRQLVDKPEPQDMHGSLMSPLRAVEMAIGRLPPNIHKYLDGSISEISFVLGEDDEYMKGKKKTVAGYCDMGDPSKIVCALDRTFRVHSSAHAMKGGLFPMELVIHEMAHAFSVQLGNRGAKDKKPKGWEGPTWEDYIKFFNDKGKHEPGVTKYAQKNADERWAESFAAALMYPQQLADTAPEMYKFMRKVMGEEAMPPLETDPIAQGKLRDAIAAEKKKKQPDGKRIAQLNKEIDDLTGIVDMPPDHPRVAWWKAQKETQLQALLRTTTEPKNYATDSAAGTFHKDDKFYEMNVEGRTIFMRIGPRLDTKGNWVDPQWTPSSVKGRLLSGNIKEIYDADGKPLSNKAAWWYLHQDIIGNKTKIPGGQLLGRAKDLDLNDLVRLDTKGTTESNALVNSLDLHGVLKLVATDQNPNLKGRPVEISNTDFRQRSGTLIFDRWQTPGDDLIDRGSAWRAKLKGLKPGTKEYTSHWAEYLKQQPNVAFEELKATAWHVKQGIAKREGQVLGRRYLTDNGIPRLTGKRFINENPDGSHTVIDTVADDDGRFYIRNPIWRQLLTPNGGDVKGGEHLRHLCQQAMEAGLGDPPQPRRAWVSVRADTRGKRGISDHYMHMEVEFDGRGQPRVLGEEWKHATGQSDPRLDDLLSPASRMQPVERTRAKVMAEKIKGQRKARKKSGRALLPTEIGKRAILNVSVTADLGHKTPGADKDVVVRLQRIIPGSKAGEVPDPPGWDRMPEGFDHPFPPMFPGEVAHKLTREEQRWMRLGILPDSYIGSGSQRVWVVEMLRPATAKWKKTLKAETKKEVPPKYIFIGEKKGGAGGKEIVRTGEQDVIDTISYPPEEPAPVALERTPLLYVHKIIDPIDGMLEGIQMRMVLPSDGHIDPDFVERLHGVTVHRGAEIEKGVPGAIEYISVDKSAIHRLRNNLGGMSLTTDAEDMLRHHAEEMRELAEASAEEEHVLPLEDIDPLKLAQMGVGLKSHLSNGTRFQLAHHQAALVQKLVDNGGRVLAAHFMGTGKTISAIVAAKLMMARSNPDSPMYDPNAPKKTLIVAPLNVVEQWRQAAAEFDEGATVVGAKSSDIPVQKYLEMVANGTDKNDLVIVGPEYFTQHSEELKEAGFDALVVDEAHMGIKNAKTQRNKAISSWNPDMKMMMLLTGTPITTSPSDILEYIKILSNGSQWSGMTRADLEQEFLEESPVPGEAGVKGKKGPKVQIKASKRDELAAILAKWVDVAMAKDVRGKTLPAIRMEESKHAEMIGIQAQLYAMQLAALSDSEKDSLKSNAALGADEMRGLAAGESRRRVQAAKAIANCPAYKPASTERELKYTTEDAEGKTVRKVFKPFGKGYLKNRKDIRNKRLRNRAKGRWPAVDELTEEQVAIYNTHYKHVIDPNNKGLTYEQVASQKIDKDQWAAMDRREQVGDQVYEPWGDAEAKEGGPPVQNPDAGPLGIRCRGLSTKRTMTDAEAALVERAVAFRRTYHTHLTGGKKPPLQHIAWERAKGDFGVDEEEAQRLMGVPPEYYNYSNSITHGGVTVTTDDEWVSDTRGSLHLLYRKQDWDFDAGKPRSAGGFAKVIDLDRVDVKGKYAWLKKPRGADDDWQQPVVRYRSDQGEKSGQRVAVEVMDGPETGVIKWVRKGDMSALVPSLMDPGRRGERAKADLAMVMGNAKAEELMAYIENFHIHTGNGTFSGGEDRGRSMVIFANGILDGCRTIEATLRVQGFRDVNEALAGSPHHDPEDGGPAPNGKYFVTYIGSTYTGDRELNIAISKKLKDKLDRDTDTSFFVHKTQTGRRWDLWPGGPTHGQIAMSQWTQEQRERIFNQFKIEAPEAHFSDDSGRQLFFYGTKADITIPGEGIKVKGSAGLLREMVLTGDPSKMVKGSAERNAAETRLKKLQGMYEDLVRAGAVEKQPMTGQQVNVMNNCEICVMSDAAQVGINKGDAVEMVLYDSLASPMAEMQRLTRSARMLPPAVRDSMMNKYITAVQGLKGGEFAYAQLQSDNPDLPGYAKGAKRIDHLWQEMQRTGKRPDGMSWVEYRERADRNGATHGSEEQFKRRGEFNADEFRDADRITYEVDGQVAVEYTPRGSDKPVVKFVSRGIITETDGPFRRIRDKLEAGAFDPKQAGAAPPGHIPKASLFGGTAATRTFQEALTEIARVADEASETAESKTDKADWKAISARARGAATLGVVQAASALSEFRTTKVPGETGNIIAYEGGLMYEDPTKGTYGLRTAAERAAGLKPSTMEQSIKAPVKAITEILNKELSAQERKMIAKAGFVKQGQTSSIDPTEIYLAMRASEIMGKISDLRPEVGRRMRAEAGGKIVTESDVMNTIIDDELTPMDRAILKSKKYLVNVRRIGVSGHVPVQIKTKKVMTDSEGQPIVDDKGNPQTETTTVFGGYEKQYPVSTERNTRAIGRARVIPVEDLLFTIQQGVTVRGDSDFYEADARDVADMSRFDPIIKAMLRFGFPLSIFKGGH